MKIGLLGGTFNPIHIGHISIAQDVQSLLALDKIIFVPAKSPPLKNDLSGFSPEARLRFVKAAISEEPDFEISDIEYHREGPSYTVQTLKEIQNQLNLKPKDLFFILGCDAFLDIKKWWNYKSLFELANFVLVTRAGSYTDLDKINTIALEMGFCYTKHIDENEGVIDQEPYKYFTSEDVAKGKFVKNDDKSPKCDGTKNQALSTACASNPKKLPQSVTESSILCRSLPMSEHLKDNKEGMLPRMLKTYQNSAALNLIIVQSRPVPISSTNIRHRLASGQSIKDLVSEAVNNLILEEDKYT